ncbi:MAG: oligosaccharide flippase family protein [Escherichia coli]|nr:oligosaccharide flippase family protein [Escherichia coli]MBL1008518.1 oligosaccharide flippase family protein [Escherichia coli]
MNFDYNIFKTLASGSERSLMVKRNIVGSFAVKGINVLISLLLIPLTIGYINSKLYGVWLTLSTIVTWISFFDIGLGNGLRNRAAEAIAHGKIKYARVLVSTSYVWIAFIFLLLAIVAITIIPYIKWTSILNIEAVYQSTITDVMRIVTVGFCITMILKVQSNVLMALQKSALASFYDTFGQILVLVGTYILTLISTPSLVKLACVVSFAPVIAYIVSSCWIYIVKHPELRPSFSLSSKRYLRDILSLGIKFFVIQINAIIFYQTINVIISNVSGPEVVTEYNVVYKYLSCAMMLFGIILSPLWSAFTDAQARLDYSWMQRCYLKLFKAFFLCSTFVVLMTVVYPFVFNLWLGDKVSVRLSMVVAIACYVIISMWQSLNTTIQNGTGKVFLQMLYSTIFAVMFIPLALLSGKEYGAEGVVWFMALIGALWGVIQMVQVKKIIDNKAVGIWAK